MKTNLLLLCLLFFLFACEKGEEAPSAVSMGAWQQKKDFPGEARSNAVAFTIGDKAYFGLGHNYETSHLQDIWEYSVSKDSWTRKANFMDYNPAAAFSVGSKGYILTNIGLLYEYDPARDNWTRKESVPGDKRWAVAGFLIGNKYYAGMRIQPMARDGVTPDDMDFWEYSPSNDTWKQVAGFPGTARTAAISFTVGNKAYFGIGWAGDHSGNSLSDVWEYDPLKNSWQKKTDYPGPRGSAIGGFAVANQNKGYVSGSAITIEKPYFRGAPFWEYTPESNSWREIKAFPSVNHSGNAAFTIQGKTFVAGGWGGEDHSKEVWEFTP